MSTPSSPVYCPLIQQMANVSGDVSNSTATASALGLFTVCLHGIISSLGILQNLLILGVVGFRIRRTVISVWILNLAASDLLATASLPFFTLFMARGKTWTLGTTFCRLHSSVFFLNMFVSAFILAAISLDRCLVVLRPVWAQNRRNVQLVGKVCGVIWAMALLCTVPFYLFRDTIPQRNGKVQCYYNYARFLPHGEDLAYVCEAREEALAFMKMLLAFLGPLLVIISSYVVVSTRLASRGSRRPLRFVRLVSAVVISFVVCWLPYHLFSIMEVVAPDRSSAQALASRALPTAASLSFLNSVLNPILYVFSCPDLCSKIRQSLSAVLETVMAEDLVDLARRRGTARSSSIINTTEVLLRGNTSIRRPSQSPEEYKGEDPQIQNS